jgi:hypothetical protein
MEMVAEKSWANCPMNFAKNTPPNFPAGMPRYRFVGKSTSRIIHRQAGKLLNLFALGQDFMRGTALAR